MFDYNIIGFFIIATLVLIAGVLLSQRYRQPFPARLIVLAIALRILGSLARYEILYRVYDGIGDSRTYYAHGLSFAEKLWDRDLSVLGFGQWFGIGRWWGTDFVNNVSGLVISVIGPTMRGEFLVFSMLGFIGLYLAARGILDLIPRPSVVRYAAWIWLWPSLWYWPSSVGKEAIIVFATGLFFFGYVGRGGRIRWVYYLTGAALAFAIRPHYAAFLLLVSGLTHWLGSWQRISVRHVLEAGIVVVLALLALSGMNALFGIDRADLEGMQEFQAVRAQNTLIGGSSLGSLPSGIRGLPAAFVNAWVRPFPWEVRGLISLLPMIELWVLWWFIWRKRRPLLSAISHWRENQLLRFALVAIVGYTLMIGYTFGNLGIIARQRTPMFVFVFIILVTASYPALERHAQVLRQRHFPRLELQRDPSPAYRTAQVPGRMGASVSRPVAKRRPRNGDSRPT